MDPTGRRDTVGKPVPFYPAARGAKPGQSHQTSAQKTQGPSKPHENAQKDPFKDVDEAAKANTPR
jgi:hypothetical protein